MLEECGDVAGLAGAMLGMCDRDKQQALCEAIEGDRVWERVSMERHARELMGLYEELVKSR